MAVHEDLVVLAVDAIDLRQALIDEEDLHAVAGDVRERRSEALEVPQRGEFIHEEQALMLVLGLRLAVLVFTDAPRMMADHHFKEEAKDRRQTKQIRRRCDQVQTDGLLIVHDVVDAEITHRRIHGKDRIQVLFESRVGRRYDTSQFVIGLLRNLDECLADDGMRVRGFLEVRPGIELMEIVRRGSALDVLAGLRIPFVDLDAIFRDVLEIRQGLDGRDEILDGDFFVVVIGVAVFVLLHRRCRDRFQEARHCVQVRRVWIEIRPREVGVFKV